MGGAELFEAEKGEGEYEELSREERLGASAVCFLGARRPSTHAEDTHTIGLRQALR